MKTALALTFIGMSLMAMVVIYTSPSNDVQAQFTDFLQTYKVGYTNDYEYDFRLQVFSSNLETIAELNKLNPYATFGVNQFADRTPEEMQKKTAYVSDNGAKCQNKKVKTLPETKSWISLMGSIKDQGNCGSCWAFSAVGAAEGRYALSRVQSTVQTRFSEQQLVDCDKTCGGCEGGLMTNAFVHMEDNDLCTEDSYKYTGRGQTCQETSKCKTGIRVKSCNTLSPTNSEIVGELQNGPISVAVDASIWSSYQGGIITNCSKGFSLTKFNQIYSKSSFFIAS
jgi:C1A family cysteine protease